MRRAAGADCHGHPLPRPPWRTRIRRRYLRTACRVLDWRRGLR